MPRLLAINNYYYRRGGAEVVFLEQNRLFEEIGWEVPVFCMRHRNNFETPWSRYFVSEIEYGQRYSFLNKIFQVSKAVYSFEARANLAQMLRCAQPDVAHCHNIYHHISPSILALLKQQAVPIVVTLHDLKLACPAYTMLSPDGICERCKQGALHNVMFHRCMKGSLALSGLIMFESMLHRLIGSYSKNVDRFVVPSRFYLEKFVEWGWDRQRFVYIPNFVDLSTYLPRYSPGNYFFYFGRLSIEKGLSTLIRASALAGVRLMVAGTGPQEIELHEVAEQSGATVSFLGYLTGNALHSALQGARAVVLPSEWYENSPLSIMEAYASGKPVIGAAVGGIPELIKEGETGATFPMGSIESLADVLRIFNTMSDSEIAQMGKAGRNWMESDFSAERYRDRILNLYVDLNGKSCNK